MNDLFASVSETDLGPLHDRLVAAAQADGSDFGREIRNRKRGEQT